ncbi:MAG: helix-turn-helix transcriptional regulator [Rickettsiaceae bacterium]|nr:helix-turn-helix transcriptional regulator [Rickettsiaceae bacterium]
MEQATSKIICNLQELAPHERLKYIRKALLGLHQDEFCSDGNISLNTLKQIERGHIRISERMSDKLLYQLQIFGIKCSNDIFTANSGNISIDIDHTVKEKDFSLSHDISKCNDKLKKLKAVKINDNTFEPFIKIGSIVFIDTNKQADFESLDQTLCIIEAATTKIFFLTYKDNQVIAQYNNEEMVFSIDALKMFKVYPIDVIFYG